MHGCRLWMVAEGRVDLRFEMEDELLKIFEADPLTGYRFMSYMVTVVGYRFHLFQEMLASMHFIHSSLKAEL
jgi:hypothetical protein